MTQELYLFDELDIDGLLDMEPEPYDPQPLAVTSNTISQPPLPVYTQTPPQILKLQEMSQRQKQRLVLNVGGTRFETSAPTLQSQPDSVLAHMVSKESPMKSYKVDNVYTYFLDRSPHHVDIILNYLIESDHYITSILPRDPLRLREIQAETNFYKLDKLVLILEKKILSLAPAEE